MISNLICVIDPTPDEGICKTETCIEVNINALNALTRSKYCPV
jgi:hypothetical protein